MCIDALVGSFDSEGNFVTPNTTATNTTAANAATTAVNTTSIVAGVFPRVAGSSVADLLALSASHLAALPVELASGGAGVSLLEEVVEDVSPVVVKPKRVRVAVGSKANKKTATTAVTTSASTPAAHTTRPVTATSTKSKTTTTTVSATTTTTAAAVAASSKVSSDVYEEEEEEEDEEDPVYYQRDTVGDEYDEEYF